jgi:two-component system cell cycle response regulator
MEGRPVVRTASDGCPEDIQAALTRYIERCGPNFGPSPHLVKHVKDEPEFRDTACRFLLVAPLQLGQTDQGWCCLLTRKYNLFDAGVIDAIEILANQLSVSFRMAKRYAEIEKRSLYDELTQLPNHRCCEQRLAEEVKRLGGTAPLSLMVIDLDHFKQINDTFGHLAGNTVLQRLARIFESSLREGDFVARYGGEEFIVVLPGATRDEAFDLAERLRRNVEQEKIEIRTMDGETLSISVTVSIGTSSYPHDAKDPQLLLRNADRAMYIGAKRAGRNRVASYQRELPKAPNANDLSPSR